jgi:hypothetical protein
VRRDAALSTDRPLIPERITRRPAAVDADIVRRIGKSISACPAAVTEGSTRGARSLTERQYGWWVRKRGRLKAMFIWWTIMPLAFVGVGYWGLRNTLVDLPARYDVLEQRGVAATATFDGCDGHHCELQLTFRGASRSWDYDINHPQFRHLRAGDPVAVIVDPRHVQTTYTAYDVSNRTNAGVGVLLVFSAIVGLVGLAGFPFLYIGARANLREWDRGGWPMGLPSPKHDP